MEIDLLSLIRIVTDPKLIQLETKENGVHKEDISVDLKLFGSGEDQKLPIFLN